MTILYFLLPYGNICSLIRLFYKISYICMFSKIVRRCSFTRIRPLVFSVGLLHWAKLSCGYVGGIFSGTLWYDIHLTFCCFWCHLWVFFFSFRRPDWQCLGNPGSTHFHEGNQLFLSIDHLHWMSRTKLSILPLNR